MLFRSEIMLALRRVTPGTPCDAQLGTYLTQCDEFVTADRALADIVERVRSQAPFRMGSVSLLPAGAECCPALFALLYTSRPDEDGST